jgi:tetratricopeptide (TPR) repeat protein
MNGSTNIGIAMMQYRQQYYRCVKALINRIFAAMELRILFVATAMLLGLNWQAVYAQEPNLTPEVQKLMVDAHDQVQHGNYAAAIIMLKQAILIAPEQKTIYRQLGEALYNVGDFDGAIHILHPLIAHSEGDAITYAILGASYAARGETHTGLTILSHGLEQFPHSGKIFHEKGKIYEKDSLPDKALISWTNGICEDPTFAENYKNAAISYLSGNKKIWGLLYGEIFTSITSDSAECALMRKLLWQGYKSFFLEIARNTPAFGSHPVKAKLQTFEEAIISTYIKLTPVVSDGITTENLTMIRTRFLMEWYRSGYATEFPFSLFEMQDTMLRNGKFDIYNEWMWGKVESEPEYIAWNTFHNGDLERFRKWQKLHPLQPILRDCYNDRPSGGMFKKR